jgi:hypothetical protein
MSSAVKPSRAARPAAAAAGAKHKLHKLRQLGNMAYIQSADSFRDQQHLVLPVNVNQQHHAYKDAAFRITKTRGDPQQTRVSQQLTLDLSDLGGQVFQAVRTVLVGGTQVAQRCKAGACEEDFRLQCRVFYRHPLTHDMVHAQTVQQTRRAHEPGRNGWAAALPRHASSVNVAATLIMFAVCQQPPSRSYLQQHEQWNKL